jgi:hypothetical protein
MPVLMTGLRCLLSAGLCAVACVLLVACADSGSAPAPASDATAALRTVSPEGPAFGIRSVTLDARRPPSDALLRRIRDLGTTHLTLIPFGWQRRPDDPSVRLDTTDGWYSESNSGIRTLAQKADTLGMDVILKPHVWIGHYSTEGQARNEVGFDTEAQWAQWEADYRRFLLHYARLAQDIGADVLVIGTELHRAAESRTDFWRQLAADARTIYDGKLTYAANWYAEYEAIKFWDALDYVGVQAYFPLAKGAAPPMDSLRAGWKRHRQTLRAIAERTDRPVLFTEVGYRSAPSAAAKPWEWPERDEQPVAGADTLQARCYRAFFEVMREAPWFAGAIPWKYQAMPERRRPTGFSPQNRPAEAVIQRWFGGPPSTASP